MHSNVVSIKNFECTPIWSLSETNALPCGPYFFRSALPYGPFGILKCTPMWSLTIFGVHSHMVLVIFRNALRSGLPLYDGIGIWNVWTLERVLEHFLTNIFFILWNINRTFPVLSSSGWTLTDDLVTFFNSIEIKIPVTWLINLDSKICQLMKYFDLYFPAYSHAYRRRILKLTWDCQCKEY